MKRGNRVKRICIRSNDAYVVIKRIKVIDRQTGRCVSAVLHGYMLLIFYFGSIPSTLEFARGVSGCVFILDAVYNNNNDRHLIYAYRNECHS